VPNLSSGLYTSAAAFHTGFWHSYDQSANSPGSITGPPGADGAG